MKWIRFALLFSAVSSLNAAAPIDFNGTWKAVFTGPTGPRPKMVTEIVFNFKVDGNKLTGMAHMGAWPGDASISEGKIEGDRVTFTVVGKSPWTSSTGGVTTSGYPKLMFDGTLKGGEMALKLNWGSILTTGEEKGGNDLEMKAERVPSESTVSH